MSNPFASDAFLAFSKRSRPPGTENADILKAGGCGRDCPFLVVKGCQPAISSQSYRFLITPICLSGPEGKLSRDLPDLYCSELPMPVAGGFVQTRMAYEGGSEFYTTERLLVHLDTRTNYRIDTSLPASDFFQSMRRDSRSRARKILKQAKDFRLVSDSSDAEKLIPWFSKSYANLGERRGFPAEYRFCHEEWMVLLKDPRWRLFVLLHNEKPVAGAVLADLGSGSDYTFMTSSGAGDEDYPRALIIFLAEQLRIEGKLFLDLGGGISEGDALARFKQSLGGAPVSFARFRFVSRQLVLGREAMSKSLLTRRWPL